MAGTSGLKRKIEYSDDSSDEDVKPEIPDLHPYDDTKSIKELLSIVIQNQFLLLEEITKLRNSQDKLPEVVTEIKEMQSLSTEIFKNVENTISLPMKDAFEFYKLEVDLKQPIVAFKLETALENVRKPEKPSEFVKHVLKKLFTNTLMQQVRWAVQTKEDDIMLKGSNLQENVYKFFKKQYSIKDDSFLDGKFSQSIRNFHMKYSSSSSNLDVIKYDDDQSSMEMHDERAKELSLLPNVQNPQLKRPKIVLKQKYLPKDA